MVSIQTGSEGPVDVTHLSRRTLLRAMLVGSAVVAVPGALAACSPATTSASPTGSGSGAVVTTKPLRVGWKSDIDTFNPLTTVTTEAVEVQSLIYDTLLAYGLDLKAEPSLATASKADGTTITYTLREGVTWHDGTPFTADDVVFTFDLISKNSLGVNAQYLTDLTSVKSPDAKTVVLTFKRPQAFDPGLVVPILPKHLWSKMSVDEVQKFPNASPVGTGPYTFKERKQGSLVTVARNEKWWGTKPAAATISWSVYTNDDILAQALKTGEVDIVPQVPPTVFGGIQGEKTLTSVTLDSFSFHHIGINVWTDKKSKGNPLLLDKNVRQALGYALNRDQIAQIAYAGQATPGGSILMPTFGDFYWEPAADAKIDNNPEKANALLDSAGYTAKDGDGIRQSKDGKPLKFRIIAIDSTSVDVRTAQLFAASAAKVGIKLDFATVDSDTMASTVYNTEAPDWDIFVWGWDSGVNDPSYMLGVPLTSQIGGNNDVFYANPAYDALYDQQATELDRAKRIDIVKQMQQMFYEDCAYLVAVYTKKLQAYRTADWTGFTEVPGGIIFNFTRDNYLKGTPAS
jgi:peptide/nickel transport system substrate-binding protein